MDFTNETAPCNLVPRFLVDEAEGEGLTLVLSSVRAMACAIHSLQSIQMALLKKNIFSVNK